MQFLNNAMNEYTCTRCGKMSIVMSVEEKKNMLCCDGNNRVVHLKGQHKIEKKPINIVQPPEPVVVSRLAPAPEVMNPSRQKINLSSQTEVKNA